MAKYNKKIVKDICSLIKKDSYTISEICSLVGISKETYYQWIENKLDFADAIKKAKGEYDEFIAAEAKKSLLKRIQGYTVQEKKVVMVESKDKDESGKFKPKIKEQTIIDKHYQPDTAAIIFTLTNKVPEEYQNKYNAELTGKNGKDLIPEPITIRIIDEKEQLNGNTNDKNIPTG
jgi:hypothetical protein